MVLSLYPNTHTDYILIQIKQSQYGYAINTRASDIIFKSISNISLKIYWDRFLKQLEECSPKTKGTKMFIHI